MWWIDAVITGLEWSVIAVAGIACAMCLTCAWFERRDKLEVEENA